MVRIITDNEWEGKYEALEQLLLQKVPDTLFSLGDNLPTGPRSRIGRNSYFKRIREELAKTDKSLLDLPLTAQFQVVYDVDPEKFMEQYADAPQFLEKGAAFINQSTLPMIQALTGNREFDYQLLLDFIAEKQGTLPCDYLSVLDSCTRIVLLKDPQVLHDNGTQFIILPYTPDGAEPSEHVERACEMVRTFQPEHLFLLTHENPFPEGFGSKRKAVMQETLDGYCDTLSQVHKQVTCFCGHLDISAAPQEYHKTLIQPISGTELLDLDSRTGTYNITSLHP